MTALRARIRQRNSDLLIDMIGDRPMGLASSWCGVADNGPGVFSPQTALF